MNLSKLKFTLVGAIIMGVFSLNFMNPFAMSNSEFDVKGVASEISISKASTQSEVTVIPNTVTLLYIVVFVTKKVSCSGDAMVNTNTNVFDGIAKISASNLAMHKLD